MTQDREGLIKTWRESLYLIVYTKRTPERLLNVSTERSRFQLERTYNSLGN